MRKYGIGTSAISLSILCFRYAAAKKNGSVCLRKGTMHRRCKDLKLPFPSPTKEKP